MLLRQGPALLSRGDGNRGRPFRVTRVVELPAWPYTLSQLAGGPGPDDADGRADDPYNDCLPAAVAAVLRWLRGIVVQPDAVRDWAYGDGTRGYTEPGPILPYLAQYGIGYAVTTTQTPLAAVKDALDKGRPVLARTREPAGYYHWTPLTGYGAGQVIRHQVYGGYRETLDESDWLARYAGWLVVIGEGK